MTKTNIFSRDIWYCNTIFNWINVWNAVTHARTHTVWWRLECMKRQREQSEFLSSDNNNIPLYQNRPRNYWPYHNMEAASLRLISIFFLTLFFTQAQWRVPSHQSQRRWRPSRPVLPFILLPFPPPSLSSSPPLLIESAAPRRIIRILIQSEFQELVCLVTCHGASACHISGDRWLCLICFKQFHWAPVYKSSRNGIDTRGLS